MGAPPLAHLDIQKPLRIGAISTLCYGFLCAVMSQSGTALLVLLTISQKQMFAVSDLLLVREANAPGSQIHEWLVTKAFIFLRQLLTV